jgi:hypothetical protein
MQQPLIFSSYLLGRAKISPAPATAIHLNATGSNDATLPELEYRMLAEVALGAVIF